MTIKNKESLALIGAFVFMLSYAAGTLSVYFQKNISLGIGATVLGTLVTASLMYIVLAIPTITDEEALQNIIKSFVDKGCKLIPNATVEILEVSREVDTMHYSIFGTATPNGKKTVKDFLIKVAGQNMASEFLLSSAKIRYGMGYPNSNDEVRSSINERILILFYDGKKIVFTY